MTDQDSTSESGADPAPETTAETAWERRRRLARIFGDALPETTSDERDDRPPADRDTAGDAWLKAQVPPHHGG